jgi:hypothetical protein
MSRRSIKKTTQPPNSYNKNIPKISIRPGENLKITANPRHKHQKINITRNFKRKTPQVSKPINFLNTEFVKTNTDICFVVGGGPSLNGFDFSQLNGFDTIAVNKAAEYIHNPTHFITTDYSYFIKASLPISELTQKCSNTYFVANMSHDYMEYQNGKVVDTRRNFVYEDLYKYTGVIESYNKIGFGSSLNEFSHGENSGHCGIQLALLLGYKKIYLLGFDLNSDGQTHFHQSYREVDQKSFKNRVNNYAETLIQSLIRYKGAQQIINLSSSSILVNSPIAIKTETFKDVLDQQGILYKEVVNDDNSTLDNLMVVGYYTVNTPYEEEAQNLLQSLNKLKVNHDIIGVKTLGNWQANTRFKAGFMLDMLMKHPNHRLLYVDVDAVVHKMPDLFKNYKCDIAVRWQDFRWRKNECLSGTIYMENNERTKRICQLWRDINVKEGNESNRMEQWNLDTVINQMKKEDPNFTYKNLPPEYTMIFDSMRGMYPNINPVIEHFQASRRFKKDVNEK